MMPAPELVDRFRRDLDALVEPDARLGVAVSGGPDSLALLLLAAAARPDLIEAATIDHGLRAEAAAESAMVAQVCEQLGVPHASLTLGSAAAPASNVQSWAREERYRALESWAVDRGMAAIATAHHADDQAETVLMRLARGAGVGGLAGVQRRRPVANGSAILLVRPLLDWSRDELSGIVAAAELESVCDPSNTDERFDRTRARQLLGATEWLQPSRLAASAAHLADAEEALDWAAARELESRASWSGDCLTLDPAGLPRELKRRLLAAAMAMFGCEPPSGPKLVAALDILEQRGITTLAGLKLEGGATWRVTRAQARRMPGG